MSIATLRTRVRRLEKYRHRLIDLSLRKLQHFYASLGITKESFPGRHTELHEQFVRHVKGEQTQAEFMAWIERHRED